MFEDRDVGRDGRRDTLDDHLVERAEHAATSGLAVDAPGHELADEVVVVLADLVAGCVSGVEAHTEAVGHDELRDAAGGGEEPAAGRVLGVDSAFDRVPSPQDRRLVEREGQTRRDADLLGDEVDARHQLGDRVLDLQPRVHLEEEELAVGIQELDGAGVGVADRSCDRHRRLAHRSAGLVGEQGSGALLDELLMAALRGAVPLADPHHVSVGVADDLHLDVARPRQVALDVDLGSPEVRQCLPLRGVDRGLDVGRPGHDLHAAAAPAVCRLHCHRPAVALAERTHFVR